MRICKVKVQDPHMRKNIVFFLSLVSSLNIQLYSSVNFPVSVVIQFYFFMAELKKYVYTPHFDLSRICCLSKYDCNLELGMDRKCL